MSDQDREAFEAWARGPAGYVDNQLARYADGSYQDSTTRLHWSIYHAGCSGAADARRYCAIRAALLSGGPEWQKLAALLNIAPDTTAGVDDAVDAALGVNGGGL
jgi:hypothetical protein